MAIVFWLVISLCVGFFWSIVWDKAKKIGTKWAVTVVSVIIILSPLYYEFPALGYSQVITFNEDNSVNYHPFGTFCLEGSDSYVNMPYNIDMTSSISPLTDNPKVRPLKYKVSVSVGTPKVFYSVFQRRSIPGRWGGGELEINGSGMFSIDNEIYRVVEYWLFEFNEENSKILSKFYNPLDDKQISELKELVENWVNPKLEKDGLVVEFKNFKIEY